MRLHTYLIRLFVECVDCQHTNRSANGNTGGDIWAEAKRRLGVADSLSSDPDRTYYQNIVDANDSNGYGWNRIEVNNIRSTKGTIRYGVSTKSSFTGTTFAGQWVSAADFNLK